MNILVLNSGSSSQKSALYQFGDKLPESPSAPLWEATVQWEGSGAEIQVRNAHGANFSQEQKVKSRREAIERILETLWSGKAQVIASASHIDVVGHRVVHGGEKLAEPAIITPDVKHAIGAVSAFAPLHNRAELEGIDIIEKLMGSVPQVAVFDTGFHRNLPLASAVYPGPYEWFEQGIRHYGFHGINHQYCAERATQILERDSRDLRIVSCHLGNGCSLAAIHGGRSVDTTMGFTPLEGLMMGTRSGSVDPGILTYLMRERPISGNELDEILNKKSGLLGISGVAGDMRQILAAIKKGNQRAELAFNIYVHRLRAGISAMAAALAGIDVLIFTAGVGEHSPEIRAATCEKLGFLGITLDSTKNLQSPPDQEISAPDSRVRVLILRSQEDWSIAKECWKLVRE
jgi:acetate kinase